MLASKKVKSILWAFGLITILFFAYSISKMYEAAIISVKHPLETYFAAFFYTAYTLGMFLSVVFLLGSTAYWAHTGEKADLA